MLTRRFLILASTLLLASPLLSGGESAWLFLPDGGNPSLSFLANPAEPRTGVRFEPGTANLRLDIGIGPELLAFRTSRESRLLFGVDLFAYALTTSGDGLRLQVDALDGFFGGHIVYASRLPLAEIALRLRILHRSAHFVDGHVDPSTGTWRGGRNPIPFTQDFAEVTGAIDLPLSDGRFRIYGGGSYSTLVRPVEIRRFAALGGMEYRTDDGYLQAFDSPLNLYSALHIGLTGIPAYSGSNSAEAGLRFGSWSGPGLMVFVAFQAGPEIYGQYYDVNRTYWHLGFSVDLR